MKWKEEATNKALLIKRARQVVCSYSPQPSSKSSVIGGDKCLNVNL